MIFYGVFRTEVLRESIKTKLSFGDDFAVDLNILKHGNVHVIDEILMFNYTKGELEGHSK